MYLDLRIFLDIFNRKQDKNTKQVAVHQEEQHTESKHTQLWHDHRRMRWFIQWHRPITAKNEKNSIMWEYGVKHEERVTQERPAQEEDGWWWLPVKTMIHEHALWTRVYSCRTEWNYRRPSRRKTWRQQATEDRWSTWTDVITTDHFVVFLDKTVEHKPLRNLIKRHIHTVLKDFSEMKRNNTGDRLIFIFIHDIMWHTANQTPSIL